MLWWKTQWNLKKVTSNETKHVGWKKLNDLLGEVKLISPKGLKKDLINGYSILNGAICFNDDGLQNYFIF